MGVGGTTTAASALLGAPTVTRVSAGTGASAEGRRAVSPVIAIEGLAGATTLTGTRRRRARSRTASSTSWITISALASRPQGKVPVDALNVTGSPSPLMTPRTVYDPTAKASSVTGIL